MKRLVFVLLLAVPVFGQEDNRIVVDKNDLPPEVLKQVQMKNAVKNYGAWAGVGKEVGEAVNGALEAVTTQTERFSNTTVGRMTVALVIWKVIGQDVVRIIAGSAIWLFATVAFVWAMRRSCFPYRMKAKRNADKSVEWRVMEPKYGNCSQGERLAGFFGAYAVMCALCGLIAFAG